MDWSQFTLKDGKRTLASPCVQIVVYSNASPGDRGKGFDHCLRTFAKRYRKALTFYRTGDMKAFRQFDSRTLEAPYHWFADEKILSKKMLSLFAHSGAAQKSFEPPGLDLTLWGFDEPPRFVFRMVLPVESASDPDSLVSFVQEALADFPLAHGHCGYALFYHPATDDDAVGPWAGPLLLRHPGLPYINPWPLSRAAREGVVEVSWLTLLGPGITADLGGVATLKKATPKQVSVLPLGAGGVLLRAGDAPARGDVNRHDVVPLYRAVGRLVSPRRASDEALNDVTILGMSEEAALDWLLRFFV